MMKTFSMIMAVFCASLLYAGAAVCHSETVYAQPADGRVLPRAKLSSVRLTGAKKTEFTWEAVPGADGYEIARCAKRNGAYRVIRRVRAGKGLRYIDRRAAAGKRYYYKVRAVRTGKHATRRGRYSRAGTVEGVMFSTDWTITQYGDAAGDQRMFYTLQDSRGHLLVVDGGWTGDAAMVQKVIADKGGHVDAWFLTHPHEDHIGAFCTIYEKPGMISIDRVYAVEMAPVRLCHANAPWDDMQAYKRFRSMKIRQLRYVHTGDEIRIGGCRIEVLSAYEKKIDRLSSDLLNDGSMVFKVYGREESMLFCADAGKSISGHLRRRYGKKLKSDYLQMGHHGNGGLEWDVYRLVDPRVAFFDAPDWLMEDVDGRYTTPQNKRYMEHRGSRVVSFATAPNTVILK